MIFTSERTDQMDDYEETAERMMELAEKQPGFLGIDSIIEKNKSITVTYWKSEESIQQWKEHPEHQLAQKKGREIWYDRYHIRIARIEREYIFQT